MYYSLNIRDLVATILIIFQCRFERSEVVCDMRKFRSFNHSACKTVLNLLAAIYLIYIETSEDRSRERERESYSNQV